MLSLCRWISKRYSKITTIPLKYEKVIWIYWNIVSYRGFSNGRTWNFIFAVVLQWPHMFQDKFVFAQLVAFLDRSKFNRIVAKYNGDRTSNTWLVGISSLRWCSDNSPTEKVCVIWLLHSKSITPNVTTWVWVRMYRNHRLHEQIRIETTAYSRNMLSIL